MKYVISIAVNYNQTKTSAGRRYLKKRFKDVLDRVWKHDPVRLKPLDTIGSFFVELREGKELKSLGRNVTITKIGG